MVEKDERPVHVDLFRPISHIRINELRKFKLQINKPYPEMYIAIKLISNNKIQTK